MKKISAEEKGKEKEKEKKIKQLMKLDLKDKFKEIFDKEESNKLTNKVSKSNQNLIRVEYDKQFSLNSKNEQTIKPRKKGKYLSIISRSPEQSNNIKSIINSQPDEVLKAKIYRVIGKKINNFSQIFEDKNNLLIDLFQKFKSQILKIRNEFNKYSNSAELNINKLKNNTIKFINFNEVYIFERKVIEYLEKRILFYIKILNSTKSIFLEDNINFDILNNFYSLIEKENTNNININKKQNYSLINNEDNHYNQKTIKEHTIGNNYNNRYNEKYIDFTINGSSQNSLIEQKNLNTERNAKVENKYNKLFLPSLKKISRNDNLLNSSTFRNSQKKHGSESKPKSNKKYDIFNLQKSAFADSIKKIKEENILSLKTSKIHKDNNKIIIEHKKEENINISNKGEDKYIKKDIKDDENINISNKGENELKKDIKEDIKDDDIEQFKEREKFRRKSVVLMTVPNYDNISNVNDYIMNYKNSNDSLDKSKNNKQDNDDDDDDKFEENQKEKKSKNKKNKTTKYRLINKEKKNLNLLLDNDYDNEENKKKMKNNLKYLKSQNNNHEDNDNNYKNKEIINDDINLKNDNENNNEGFNSEKSNSDSEEDEDKNSNKNKIMNNNNHIKNDEEEEINENNSSTDNKDPLDDVKYLKKLREKMNKENYGIY